MRTRARRLTSRLPGRRMARGAALALLPLSIAGLIAGCGGSSDATSASGGAGSVNLNLVAYSTPKKAFDALTAAFAQTSAGKGVSFSQSFGASGSQSRAVDTGQPADVVEFSTTPDMTRLVKDGIVAKSWDAHP